MNWWTPTLTSLKNDYHKYIQRDHGIDEVCELLNKLENTFEIA
jgi:hypothetical protein